MGKKGQRSEGGKPENPWGETKGSRYLLRLTPTGRSLLNRWAGELGITLPELIERYSRQLPTIGVVTSISELVERCQLALIDNPCFPENRLTELIAGGSIRRAEIWAIAQALDLDEQFVEGLANECGILGIANDAGDE